MAEMNQLQTRFPGVAKSHSFRLMRERLGLGAKKVLDIGCGFGEYLVFFGPGSMGLTTTPHEVEFAAQAGTRVLLGNAERIDELNLPAPFDALWANNLFEHLLSPHAFLISLKPLSHGATTLVLGVPVIPRIASLMRLRKFRGALAAAHINFFTRESLRLTVERAGWRVSEVRPFIFSNSFLDLLASFFAPHLYVVAHNDTSFRYHDKKRSEWGDPMYQKLIAKAEAAPHVKV